MAPCYLCVCSDPKVSKGLDEIEIRPEDTDFPVRTDPAIVGRFLDGGGDAVSVVFCTHPNTLIRTAQVMQMLVARDDQISYNAQNVAISFDGIGSATSRPQAG